ncbi:MAG: hypothetical protein WC285_00970 [Candidatus Gracilibacteria bacterium]|jgi:hypothetical protein
MNLDQAITKAFTISLFLHIKFPEPVQRQSFLETLLNKPAQDKREFFATLLKADKSLEDLKNNFLNSAKETNQKIIKISEEAKGIWRAAKIKTIQRKRQSLTP